MSERLADLCRVAIEQASDADAPRLLEAGTTVARALDPLVLLVPPDQPRPAAGRAQRLPTSRA